MDKATSQQARFPAFTLAFLMAILAGAGWLAAKRVPAMESYGLIQSAQGRTMAAADVPFLLDSHGCLHAVIEGGQGLTLTKVRDREHTPVCRRH